jgi:hypothetical protein
MARPRKDGSPAASAKTETYDPAIMRAYVVRAYRGQDANDNARYDLAARNTLNAAIMQAIRFKDNGFVNGDGATEQYRAVQVFQTRSTQLAFDPASVADE